MYVVLKYFFWKTKQKMVDLPATAWVNELFLNENRANWKKNGVEVKRWMGEISSGHKAFTIILRVNSFVNWFGNENAP